MKKQDDELHYFVCVGPAFDALVAYKAEITALVQNHENLQKDFNDRAVALKVQHEAKLHSLWVTMVMRLGLDPVKTWQNPEYQVETRYLPDGFGAVVYEPIPDSPFARAMGQGKEGPDEPAMEVVPEKGMLN